MNICFALRPLIVGFVLFASLCAHDGAYAGVTNGQIKSVIVSTGTIVKIEDLDFGDIAVSNTAGTVTVTPQAVRTTAGGAVILGTSFTPAAFSGRGSRRNQQVTINFGAPATLITRAGGTEQMTVNNFTVGTAPDLAPVAAGRRFRITPADRFFEFTVGATLLVGANQAPGTYSGDFTVTVIYQ